jgi:hypothetical protein
MFADVADDVGRHYIETWKPIPGFQGYEVSDFGRVRSWKKPGTKELRNEPIFLYGASRRGKVKFCLSASGARSHSNRSLANLIYSAFVAPVAPGNVVIHINEDTHDCRISNLRSVPVAELWRLTIERQRRTSSLDNVSLLKKLRRLALSMPAEGMSLSQITKMAGNKNNTTRVWRLLRASLVADGQLIESSDGISTFYTPTARKKIDSAMVAMISTINEHPWLLSRLTRYINLCLRKKKAKEESHG